MVERGLPEFHGLEIIAVHAQSDARCNLVCAAARLEFGLQSRIGIAALCFEMRLNSLIDENRGGTHDRHDGKALWEVAILAVERCAFGIGIVVWIVAGMVEGEDRIDREDRAAVGVVLSDIVLDAEKAKAWDWSLCAHDNRILWVKTEDLH